MQARRFGWTIGLLVALSGAALMSQSTEVSLARDVQPVLDRHCVKCHGVKEQKGRLDLSAAVAYQNLVDATSSEVPSMVRVKPGDAELSYLWLKLEHRTSVGSGMPKGFFFAKHLNQKDMDTIKAWIDGGAKP
jgi:hypothetical protein